MNDCRILNSVLNLIEHKNETLSNSDFVMSNHSPDLEESGRHNHSRLAGGGFLRSLR
jgi:hypothetical protein